MYEQCLKYHCQRYSNNSKPLFSDEEILTIYFFVAYEQKYTFIKDIHNFAKEYLRDWFPNLVSYQTFNYRLNRMASAVSELSSQLLSMFKPSDCQEDTVIVDSMPIITCCGRNRKGKVAKDITDKGYCSTKNLYYHGLSAGGRLAPTGAADRLRPAGAAAAHDLAAPACPGPGGPPESLVHPGPAHQPHSPTAGAGPHPGAQHPHPGCGSLPAVIGI